MILNQEEKYIYMTTQPIPKLICALAIPTIISMLVTSFYNMVDTFFVGRLDTQSIAAVGVTFSMMSIIQAVGFFFGHGSGNYISRKLGCKEVEDAAIMASNGFFLSFLCGVFIAIIGLIFLNPLSLLLGSTPTVLPYTKKYLGIILLGTPFMTSSLVLNNQLRFQGNASFGMIGIVTGAVVNIILDPILIFACNLGISGAALATVISQFCSFLLLFIINRKSGGMEITYKNLKINMYYIKEITKGGFPSICRQGIAAVTIILLNQAAGVYGDEFIAGMSIVSRITMFANSALIGFGQGFQPVCGFNYGAKLYTRVREGFYFCLRWAFIFLFVVSLVCGIFAENLVLLFSKDDAGVIKIGTLALRLQCISFPLNSLIVVSNMMLQSIGKVVNASILASARQGIFFLPLILVLPRIMGSLGIQITQPIADFLTFIIAIPLTFTVLKEMKE